MSESIPIPAYANLTQYKHIQCVRPTDGLVMRAQRIVVDEHTPIRWTIVVEGKSEQWRDLGWTEDGTRETYSTSELKELAKKAGFGGWQQSQVGEMEGLALVDGDERKIRLPQYQVPDLTPYPVD